MSDEDLKPCPFCGYDFPIARYDFFIIHGTKEYEKALPYKIVCSNCHSQTQECASIEDAKKSWNRRSPK